MSQSKSKSKQPPARKRRSPWPVVLVLGGLLLVAVVIAGSQLSRSSQGDEASGPGTPALSVANMESSPEAQIDALKVDFGDMKLGAELATLRLTLRNSGDKTLQFSQAPYIQLADGC
jgi:hypothetical protein